MTRKINKDYYAGAVVIQMGLSVTLKGISYQIGTLHQMGLGFFPATVGALMVMTGFVIALQGASGKNSVETRGTPQWRSRTCIIGSLVASIAVG